MPVGLPPPTKHRPTLRWKPLLTPFIGLWLLVAVVAISGSDRTPADATTPVLLRNPGSLASPTGRTFRIGTFNIHGGRSPDGNLDLAATAEVLRSSRLDYVGLNEVHGYFDGDQAADLGTSLDMASLFAGTERRWWHDHFGNAALTRFPVSSALHVALPGTQSKRFRNAILATFEIDGVPIQVISTHLDTQTDRDRQLDAVFSLFRSLSPPVVLMGDLNATAEYPPVRSLLRDSDVVDAIAAKLGPTSQAHRIDHLLIRGLEVVDAGVVDTAASDHPHVWAELSLPPAPHGAGR